MNIGAMYSDSNKKTTFTEKIESFINDYIKKYNKTPTECHINDELFKENKKELKKIKKIKVSPDASVQKYYFWIGSKKVGYEDYVNAKIGEQVS